MRIRVLDADAFLRVALFDPASFDPERHCHRPLTVREAGAALGDAVIDRDVILVWTHEKRLITGADILGRLLRGIAREDGRLPRKPAVPPITPTERSRG